MTIDRSLKFHAHVRVIVRMGGGMANNVLSCTVARNEDFMMNVYRSHIRPLMDFAASVWNVGYIITWGM